MDYFINAANLLYILAYFVRDMLVLRALTLVAASHLCAYFYFRVEPLMTPVYWNLFFIAINICWVVRLVRERRQAGAGRGSMLQVPQALRAPLARLQRRRHLEEAAWVAPAPGRSRA